jgi:hypothetical protein
LRILYANKLDSREDATLVFVQTIERQGEAIPSSDLASTIAGFATESRGLFDDDTKALLDKRLAQLDATVAAQPPARAAVVADVAAVARLFPSRLATETYYLGRDLFDILYPVVRGVLCVGLAAALLATSLPIAAKILWVAFPRLGESCMTDVIQAPPGFRDSVWVEFAGTIDARSPGDVVLIPSDNAN